MNYQKYIANEKEKKNNLKPVYGFESQLYDDDVSYG